MGGVGRAPQGVEHQVGAQLPAVRAVADEFIADALQPHWLKAAVRLDAALGHRLGQPLPQVGVEAAQRQIGAVGQRHCAAEAAVDAGEFHCDVAGAEHQQAARQRGQLQHLVGSRGQLDAGDVRMIGRAAGGDQQPLRPQALAIDLHRVRVQYLCVSLQQLHVGVRQQFVVDRFQPGGLGVFRSGQA